MREMLDAEGLRRLRVEAGLSQRQLAATSGLPQPNIAAHERGRRVAAAPTAARLFAALRSPTIERVRAQRSSIVDAAVHRGITDVRVFGSLAHGTAGTESDVDLLVHPGPETSVFDMAGFMADVADALGVEVDVVSDRGTGPAMARIKAEAVPL